MSAYPVQGLESATGAFRFVRVDAAGRVVTVSGGAAIATVSKDQPTDQVEGVILAAPCIMLEVSGYNASGADRYLMLFDALAAPADGAPPEIMPIRVPAGGHFTRTWQFGREFKVGCAWVSSSTRATVTRTLAADMTIEAQRSV